MAGKHLQVGVSPHFLGVPDHAMKEKCAAFAAYITLPTAYSPFSTLARCSHARVRNYTMIQCRCYLAQTRARKWLPSANLEARRSRLRYTRGAS